MTVSLISLPYWFVVDEAVETWSEECFQNKLVDGFEAVNLSDDAPGIEVELVGERRLLFLLLDAGNGMGTNTLLIR